MYTIAWIIVSQVLLAKMQNKFAAGFIAGTVAWPIVAFILTIINFAGMVYMHGIDDIKIT
jgi:hypothetical protein